MKRTIILLPLFFGLHQMMLAQGTFIGGQGFNINFSAISGSATNQPSGGASYFQVGWDYNTSSSVSNLFIVSFSVGTNAASDGWILQMNDGSLSPVLELTNELVYVFPTPGSPVPFDSMGTFPGGGGSEGGENFYSQNWQLADDQVQNLLAGNWYAEIDYGGNTYLGNLMPVPEPETLALLGLGIASIYFRGRKAIK